MYKKLLFLLSKIENNVLLSSIKKGFILIIPIVMTGSFALLVKSFPLLGFQTVLNSWANGIIMYFLNCIYDSTFGFMSLYLTLSISYYYSETFLYNNTILRISSMIVALACFFASFGGLEDSIIMSNFSAVGIFTAIICSTAATKLFYVFYKIISKKFNYSINKSDINYKNSLLIIFPLIICIIIFILIHKGIGYIFNVDNFNELFTSIFIKLFENFNSNLLSGMFYIFILNLLWFFGIHGGNVLEQVSQTILVPANIDSSLIISKSFLDNFVLLGGCGSTICMVLAMIICSKSNTNKRLARYAFPAIIFNINEILVFGFPIVLNPILFVPFLTVPIVSFLIAYFSTVIGILPVVTETVSWTTPILINGYAATNSFNGIFVQIVIIAVGTIFYIPFIRLSEKIQDNCEKILIEQLVQKYKDNERKGLQESFLNKTDQYGISAKNIANKLNNDIANNMIPVYYQPQLDKSGTIVGAEALLRWKYKDNALYPPLVIALAKETDLYNDLTICILEKVLFDIQKLFDQTGEHLLISVNITSEQLNNIDFIKMVIDLVKEKKSSGSFCVEVTEESSLVYYDNITKNIELLKHNGIYVAIDDFSMGCTSLKYLQNNSFNYVKLDGELVRQITNNKRCQEIINSIISLGKGLNFKIVAEYVENKEIEKELIKLNCDYFQGYLYSPAIPIKEFVDFYIKNKLK